MAKEMSRHSQAMVAGRAIALDQSCQHQPIVRRDDWAFDRIRETYQSTAMASSPCASAASRTISR
jgi:hypothetical protein